MANELNSEMKSSLVHVFHWKKKYFFSLKIKGPVSLLMDCRSFKLVHILAVFTFMLTITRFSIVVANSTETIRCVESERETLLKFKQGLGDSASLLPSWGSKEEEDCCRWRGIGCNNKTGYVIKLDLSSISSFYDPKGFGYSNMTGEISPSLLELKFLNHLDLSYNYFGGSIPEFIGSLTELTYLNLSFCRFNGTIPPQLGNLSNLKSLDLSYNSDLEVENLEWVSNLSSLRLFWMININLVRALDWLQSINSLPSLSNLDLSWSQLPETILSNIINSTSKSLQVLNLSQNSLNSSVFSWLFSIGSNLVDLRLSSNKLKGPIPDSFEVMTSLAHLSLSGNKLQGGIPTSFGKLCNLQTLYMSRDNLGEKLPALVQNLTSGCTKNSLEFLGLSSNQLSGSMHDITRFSSLRELYLDDNQLDGSIPESLSQFSELTVLDLSGNQLNGSLPEGVGQLSSLRVLDVSSNALNGVITEAHLSNLSKLQHLGFSFNSLALNFNSNWVPPFQLDTIKCSSCMLGPNFPSWLRTQNNFSHLDISNSSISDAIPDWFWNLSPNLRYLNLSFNHVNGKVLPSLSLEFDYRPIIDLSSNSFHGPIPLFLFNGVVLNLSKNKFSGSISSSICSTMTEKVMTYLDLSDNMLSGGLPDCWMYWERLTILNLENNNFSGMLPSSMGIPSLQSLRLRNNSFYGKLPSSLKDCGQLNLIDVGENKFSGNIPAWIGENLTNLILLRMRSNEFSGSLPISICGLESLQVLDLSVNKISGRILPCLENFTAMAQKESTSLATISYYYDISNIWGLESLSNYDDSALVVWKGIEREYGKTLGLLKVIDLSCNALTGEIPGEVTSLLGLITLNLSRNHLTGIIPKNIGQLQLLESLDLSKNQLGREIPVSLARLTYLSYLDLSNNSLSGRIPFGTQLQSFTSSQYMGNPQLCGPPLLTVCPGDETDQDLPNSGDDGTQEGGEWFGTKWTYASVGLGFILGFCGICGPLVLSSSWRRTYFHFLNDMWDKF